MKTAAARLAFALFAATILCACEKDKARDKWEDAKEKVGASDENVSGVTAAGTWTGTAGLFSGGGSTGTTGPLTGTKSPGANSCRTTSGSR